MKLITAGQLRIQSSLMISASAFTVQWLVWNTESLGPRSRLDDTGAEYYSAFYCYLIRRDEARSRV